ncbi:hypothetical protein [Streptomyces hydrogenans]|uniref:hypothetical protein n=1 Tax=Streptomyces hydrogenans TaxID=1873719 RepID=UPI003D759427
MGAAPVGTHRPALPRTRRGPRYTALLDKASGNQTLYALRTVYHRLTTACAATVLGLATPPGGGQADETTWSTDPVDASDIVLIPK